MPFNLEIEQCKRLKKRFLKIYPVRKCSKRTNNDVLDFAEISSKSEVPHLVPN